MIKILKSTIDLFFTSWNVSLHSGQRLGQDFYDFIEGYKITSLNNKELLDKLYNESDDIKARKIIDSLTDFNQ